MHPFGFQPDGGLPPYPLRDDGQGAGIESIRYRMGQRAIDIQYLGRDGVDVQGQGANADQYAYSCYFAGDGFERRFYNLDASIKTEPRGRLTDPLLGERRAFCLGIEEANVDWLRELDTVRFTVSFRRDETSYNKALLSLPTVQQKAAALEVSTQGVQAQLDALLARAASLSIPKLPTLISTANQYRLAALASVASNSIAFAMEDWRGKLRTVAGEAMAQVRALGFPDQVTQPVIAAITRTVSSSEELGQATQRSGPQVVTYEVQQHQTVGAATQKIYGGRGAQRLEQIRRDNRLRGFGVAAGTKLRVAGPIREDA